MTSDDLCADLSRRKLLAAAGIGCGIFVASSVIAGNDSNVVPSLPPSLPQSVPQSRVNGLHLQFGADACTELVVSWHSSQPVRSPRVLLGNIDGRLEKTVQAIENRYVDAKSKKTVYVYHARLVSLKANTSYLYAAVHEGASPEFGTFSTAPAGRSHFTFTSFGDQATPTIGRKILTPSGIDTKHKYIYLNDNLGSPAAGDTIVGVEQVRPLFHLLNGDLCYANLSEDRIRTWWDFWENNSRSARNRPWMPAVGNHENERGNGPLGYQAYQTYFSLPYVEGQTDLTRGLWYAFTVGSVRVISLANDDVCYQNSSDTYIRGYSNGAQKAWLEKELAATRQNKAIDWIVVCMHQVAISTADKSNGADLGIRQEWLPLFDRYGVDLVVCGHEHHYERSHPIRGQQNNATLTPIPVGKDIDVIDTTKGTVHMVIGCGGNSSPSNELFFDPPQCRVTTAVGNVPDPKTGRRPSIHVHEEAPWSAVRNAAHAYGFAAFAVDPGTGSGDFTTITVTYYDVFSYGQLSAFETFKLRRPRRD